MKQQNFKEKHINLIHQHVTIEAKLKFHRKQMYHIKKQYDNKAKTMWVPISALRQNSDFIMYC